VEHLPALKVVSSNEKTCGHYRSNEKLFLLYAAEGLVRPARTGRPYPVKIREALGSRPSTILTIRLYRYRIPKRP